MAQQRERTAAESSQLNDIAVGVPVLSRSGALEGFIESVPRGVSRVIIADNGMPGAHSHVYTRDWHVDIDVLDLDHDIGIGACRAALVEAVDEPYLWMGDCDMQFTRPDDLARLREILDGDAQLGGVSGWLIEDGTVRSAAKNLRVVNKTLIKTAANPKMCQEPYPHARFDFIPQCGLFRAGVFETYGYDDDLVTHEHMDLFFGQLRAGEWAFASTPIVQIQHNKWVDTDYRQTRGKHDRDTDFLERKWGIKRTQPGGTPDWVDWRDRSLPEQAFDVFRSATPARVWLPVRRALKRVGVA